MTDRPFSPYNKIGLHLGPGANLELLQNYVTGLDSAAIPVFVTAVSDYTPLARILEWTRNSVTPHTLTYYPYIPDASNQFGFDKVEYYQKTNPNTVAIAYWRLLLSVLPSDLVRDKVWIGVLNDLRELSDDQGQRELITNWLGEFGFAIARLAVGDGYKIALFGWQSGHPNQQAWTTVGMERLLDFCQSHKEQAAIALQEFSNDPKGVFDTSGGGIGRFRTIFTAADQYHFLRPNILITTWGWRVDNVPGSSRAIDHIRQAGELYAQYPEVLGAAIWTLGEQPSEVDKKVERLVEPLIKFTLEHRYAPPPSTPPATSAPPQTAVYTAPATKTAEPPDEDEPRARLALGQARRQQFENAIATSLKINDATLRNRTLLEIGQQILVDEGYNDEYNKVAAAILNQEQPDEVWLSLVRGAVELDNLDLAAQVTEKIQDTAVRANTLNELAAMMEPPPAETTKSQPVDIPPPTPEKLLVEEVSNVPPMSQTAVSPQSNVAYGGTATPNDEPEDSGPQVWLYMADGKDERQMIYLQQPVQIIWRANSHTADDDIILMYRTDPHQDISHLFRAKSNPNYQEDTNDHAIRLGDKVDLERPLKRTDMQAHPSFKEWSLARTPQGAMQRSEDIRAEGYWQPLRGYLVAQNPMVASYLAEWEKVAIGDLWQEAVTVARDIPDTSQRRDLLLHFIETLRTDSRSTAAITLLREDADRPVRRAARQALGEPLPVADTLEEAKTCLRQQQYTRAIQLLQTEDTQWLSSNNQHEQATGHALLAQAYEETEQAEAALSHWQQAATLNPNNAEAFEGIGRTTPQDKLADAEQFIKGLQTQSSQAPGPAVGLATLAERRDDLPTAAAYLSEAAANAATPALRQQIESRREIIIQYLPQSEAAPTLIEQTLSETEQKLIRLLRDHFNREEIKDLCVELALDPEELSPAGLSSMARELVLSLGRSGRLAELEARILALRPHIYQESAATVLEEAQESLARGQYQQVLQTLQTHETKWQNGTIPERATAHGILAQAYEQLQQPQQAYSHWKKKAALLPNVADAFTGIGRTAPEEKLAEAEQFVTDIHRSNPEAVGPAVALAQLDRRQGKMEEATRHLAAVPTASLVQRKRIDNEVARLRDNPTAVPTLQAPERPTGNLAANELTLTLQDLLNVATEPEKSGLDTADQLEILQKFMQQTLQLPTLSLAQKRDLRQRTARVLVEAKEMGRVTPQLVMELQLPALESLFMTKPGHRRALLRVVESYRRLPYRRLWLYLRQLARQQIVKLLPEESVNKMRGERDEAALQTSYQMLRTAVWSSGDVVFPGQAAQTIEQLLSPAAQPVAVWRKVVRELVVVGNLGYTVPDSFFASYTDRVPELWGLLYDLLYNRQGSYEHLDSWGRFKHSPLENLPPTILLNAFYPQEHLPYHPKTAVAALTALQLKEKTRELDYRAYVQLAQTLLRDEELGFANLEDVGCFFSHLANHKVSFWVDEKEETHAAIHPPLLSRVNLNPTLIDTELTLPGSLFNQMSSALNTGNHIILIGPPGTGKTSIALDVCRLAHDMGCSRGFISVTATADWTTFDTVGGYMPTAEGQLAFSEGIFLRAIREQKWLIIDEINRAEIDKAFGELFTVLSGQAVVLPYRDGYHPIRILPAGAVPQTERDYVIAPTWRVIGTMNVYDKASLFEMSYAFMRRFAFVDVSIPDDGTFGSILEQFMERAEVAADSVVGQVICDVIFKQGEKIMSCRPLGPAIARDMIRYVGQRQQQVGVLSLEHLGEAFLLYAIPQFDGLEETKIKTVYDFLSQIFRNAPESAVAIRHRLRDLFPHYTASLPSEEEMKTLWPPEENPSS